MPPTVLHSLVSLLLLFAVLFVSAPQKAAALAQAETQYAFAEDDDKKIIVCLTVAIPAKYHAYAHDPGDAGKATELFLTAEQAGNAAVYYPAGAQQPDSFDKSAQVNVYEGTQNIFAVLPPEAAGKPWKATLSMLLCSNFNCIPWDETKEGTLPEKLPKLSAVPWKDAWLAISAQTSAITPTEAPITFGMADPSQSAAAEDLTKKKADEEELPPPPGFNFTLTPRYDTSLLEVESLGGALLLGLLAGLILNVMPCVLPVIAIKTSGLLQVAGEDPAALKKFRWQNICFALGILSLFTFLAVLLGGLNLMWGQLFQSQEAIVCLTMMVFLMGLSALGVFTLPMMNMNKFSRESKNPYRQSYFEGLFCTFLATPCSGPMLGSVLSWSFTQPLLVQVVIFLFIGIGMALPFFALAAWPKLAACIPRSSDVLLIIEQVLGCIMLAVALYLFSMLPDSRHTPVLLAMLASGIAAFFWGKYRTLTCPQLRRTLLNIFFAAVLIGSTYFAWTYKAPEGRWSSFSIEHFTEQLGKRPMVLTFTADWCANCKFVETATLTEKKIGEVADKYNAEFIMVDFTQPNAAGTKLLEMLGSRSLPVTAIFPAGDMACSPVVLRDLFFEGRFDDAVKMALEPAK